MAVLVPAGIKGLNAPPMMQLALLPLHTARQKSPLLLGEANGIAVREQAADSPQGLPLPQGCRRGEQAGEEETCPRRPGHLPRHRIRRRPHDIGEKVEPGKSIPSQAELHFRAHDIGASECSRVDASVNPPQIVSDTKDDQSSHCVVEDYEDRKVDRDPAGNTWNDPRRGGVIVTAGWKDRNSTVDDQEPPAGAMVDSSTPWKREFRVRAMNLVVPLIAAVLPGIGAPFTAQWLPTW